MVSISSAQQSVRQNRRVIQMVKCPRIKNEKKAVMYQKLQKDNSAWARQEQRAFVIYRSEISSTPIHLGRPCPGWQPRGTELTSDESALCEFVYLIIREIDAWEDTCDRKPSHPQPSDFILEKTHLNLEPRADPRECASDPPRGYAVLASYLSVQCRRTTIWTRRGGPLAV